MSSFFLTSLPFAVVFKKQEQNFRVSVRVRRSSPFEAEKSALVGVDFSWPRWAPEEERSAVRSPSLRPPTSKKRPLSVTKTVFRDGAVESGSFEWPLTCFATFRLKQELLKIIRFLLLSPLNVVSARLSNPRQGFRLLFQRATFKGVSSKEGWRARLRRLSKSHVHISNRRKWIILQIVDCPVFI